MSRSSTKVILVSHDRELWNLCRGVLRELSVTEPVLEAPGTPHRNADLTIWDLSLLSGRDHEQDAVVGNAGDLFVVSRQAVPHMQKLIPAGALGLLLKPLKRPILHAFLSAALNKRPGPAERSEEGRPDRDYRDDLLQALLEANLRLQECDQDRTNFLARVLHDFRTPLTALQGYCDMLIQQRNGLDQPDQIDLLRRMQHSVGRLSRMSKAMFELSVHSSRKEAVPPRVVKMNIDRCIQNSVEQIMPIAQEKDISLSIDLDPPDTELYADPAAIEQVLVNLLENACKFTGRRGLIEIHGHPSYANKHVPALKEDRSATVPVYLVEVQDNGMGIAPEHLESVFEEFTSYAGAGDRSGGGLGLAICKMVIAAHKGAIWAESNRDGTKISFTLPVQQDAIAGLVPATAARQRAIQRSV